LALIVTPLTDVCPMPRTSMGAAAVPERSIVSRCDESPLVQMRSPGLAELTVLCSALIGTDLVQLAGTGAGRSVPGPQTSTPVGAWGIENNAPSGPDRPHDAAQSWVEAAVAVGGLAPGGVDIGGGAGEPSRVPTRTSVANTDVMGASPNFQLTHHNGL
jgi:hypothetical protein